MALLIMLENARNALDNGECAIGVFLDFQKAFDTVDHAILLDKLYNYGIRGISKYNDYESEARKILCGVPQGSILGQLLFLIYNLIYLWSPAYSCLYNLIMTQTCFAPMLNWISLLMLNLLKFIHG